MKLTTGAILRRITESDLSAASHKLATIILDGIAWKDGYNGLARGTAAFTLDQSSENLACLLEYSYPGILGSLRCIHQSEKKLSGARRVFSRIHAEVAEFGRCGNEADCMRQNSACA